jgi:hypothetical protein
VLPEGNIRLDSAAEYDAVVTLSDGRLLVEGPFARVDGERVAGPVLLDANGRLLRALSPRCVGQTVVPGRKPCRLSLLALPDGGFVVAGPFEAIDGEPIAGIARYRPDGTLDTAFRPLASVTAGQQPALIGARLRHLYFRDAAIAPVRRVALSPPYAIDPDYLATNPGTAPVLDNLGRLYFIGTSEFMGVGVFRRQPDGAVDPEWSAQLPGVSHLWHEPVTDAVLLESRNPSSEAINAIARARLDATGGLDPEWRLAPSAVAALPSLQRTVRSVSRGQLLVEQFDGMTRLLTVNDAATGNLVLATPHSLGPGTRFFGGEAGGWVAALPRARVAVFGMFVLRPTNQLVRLEATLTPTPDLVTDIHRTGAAFALGRANDGGWFIAGEFSAVDRTFRHRIAKLRPDWRLEQRWQSAETESEFPRLPLAWVGQAADGPVLSAEYSRAIQAVGTYPPGWLLSAADGSRLRTGGVARRPFAGALAGEHFYGSAVCRPQSGSADQMIWRVRLSDILPLGLWGCPQPDGWQVEGSSWLMTASADGWLYYTEFDPSSTRLTVRRVRMQDGAVPDPGFAIPLMPPAPNRTPLLATAANSQHVYLSLSLAGPDTSGRLVRFDASTGAPDPSWPNIVRANGFGGIAVDEHWLYSWDRVALGGNQTAWELTRRSTADGRPTGTLRAENWSWIADFDNTTPPPSVQPLGDGRAAALWYFVALDGKPRDGFAIVGSVETILADGFEAR